MRRSSSSRSSSPFSRSPASPRPGGTTINLVAFSTPKRVIGILITAWKTDRRPADRYAVLRLVGHAGEGDHRGAARRHRIPLECLDINSLASAGLVVKNWPKTRRHGIVANSVVAFVVRPGNPKNIHTWANLTKPGVQVVTPDPFTSGGAKWNVLAAYGAERKMGLTDKKATAYVSRLFHHVVEQATSASNAMQTFLNGKGDVLLTYECEAYTAFAASQPLKIVIPSRRSYPVADGAAQESSGARRRRSSSSATRRRRRGSSASGYRPVISSVLDESRRRRGKRGSTRGHDLPDHRQDPRRLGEGEPDLVRPERTDDHDRAGFWRTDQLALSRLRPPHGLARSAPAGGPRGPLARRDLDVSRDRRPPADRCTSGEARRRAPRGSGRPSPIPRPSRRSRSRSGAALIVTAINAVLGTITAWVLVRDDFRGRSLVNAVIDLPFALPTIVAGLTLLTLYGDSPVGLHMASTRGAIVLALCFVTLPFVVRTVQPVLLELDQEMEQAARSLGASNLTVFRRIVLPNLLPGILSGCVLPSPRARRDRRGLGLHGTRSTAPRSPRSTSTKIQDSTARRGPVAVVLLGAAFVLLLAFGVIRFLFTRHERA